MSNERRDFGVTFRYQSETLRYGIDQPEFSFFSKAFAPLSFPLLFAGYWEGDLGCPQSLRVCLGVVSSVFS